MKYFFSKKTIGLYLLALGVGSSIYAAATLREIPLAPFSKRYIASMKEGQIGATQEIPADNPSDNIFHVSIEDPLQGNEKVWLSYELAGVEDHTAVSRSINDGLAVGGYLVKKRQGWAKQREQVDVSWLKKGDNVIRFTLPQDAKHSYRIRNLALEVERDSWANETDKGRKVIINQSLTYSYYNNRAYLKGFVLGAAKEGARIFIDGQEARMFKGEFEGIIERKPAGNEKSFTVKVQAIYPDGQTLLKEVSFENSQKADYNYQLVKATDYTQKTVVTSQAGTISLKGAFLTATAGALSKSARLSITTLREVDMAALDPGMVNVTRYSAGFRFLPHGTLFAKEVNLRMAYDENKIPEGYTEKDIKTYYFDEQSHHWVALPTDTVLAQTVEIVSRTAHFTDMINAIIKVPESPEVQAYNSTSMKGIKAANPTAGVNLLNAPSANNTGNASMGYPLNLPAGRNGMQPQLAISYNSGGGNGWLGLGWNLSVPAISIDTRWGAPRYDAAKETETYSFNGEQLTPVAHRGEWQNRTSEKQFYPRVEGGFNKIIRHGNSPKNYWWEVTDKSGVKYFYGGKPGSGVDNMAVLRDKGEEGNIGHWSLVEVRDLDDNFVRYQYTKVTDNGMAKGTVPGYQLYVAKITYTGHGATEGKYSVLFTRDREISGWTKRKDVSIHANLGFKQVTADLLKKVDVQFEGNNIRSYELAYKQGAFNKTLLSGISEFDGEGNKFTTHDLDYFDEVNSSNSGFSLFPTVAQPWVVPEDAIKGTFTTSDDAFLGRASVLSGTKSSSISAGTSVGVGFDLKLWLKSNSVGGNVNFDKATSEGMTSLIDINGDGLPDKVFVGDRGIQFRPNISGPNGSTAFGGVLSVNLPRSGTFHKEKSVTTSVGVEAQFGEGVSASIGASTGKTTATTTVYFTEANGDQLIDVVIDGKVYFNHIDSQTGIPTFTLSSGDTPSKIGQGNPVDPSIIETDPAELESARTQNPLHDIVRVWTAPYAGTIQLFASVQLLPPTEEAENADGVRVSIQHNAAEVWATKIGSKDFNVHSSANGKRLVVNKGDKIYFRVQSVENGENDQVKWAPVISYVNEDLTLADANNKAYYRYSIEEDYILTAPIAISAPIKGQVAFTGKFKKGITSDNVTVEVVSKKEGRPEIVEVTRNYAWNQTADDDLSKALAVDSAQSLSFRVRSSTTIDWSSIQWQPYLYYTASNDCYRTPVMDDKGKYLLDFYPVPDFSLYGVEKQGFKGWKVTQEVDTIIVVPSVDIKNNVSGSADVVFTIKKKGELVAKETYQLVGGKTLTAKPVKVAVKKGEYLYFDYHTASKLAFGLVSKAGVVILSGKDIQEAGAGFYEKSELTNFGPAYRQWGHFSYNGNGDKASKPIDQSLLKVNQALEKQKKDDFSGIKEGKDLESNQDVYKPSQENFIILVPVGKERIWNGYDAGIYLNGTTLSSGRYGADDITPVSFLEKGDGGGAFAINKVTQGRNSSVSGGVSGSMGAFNVGGTLGLSGGPTWVVTDFMDMNGDRYPDVVTPGKIQYSQANGGLSDWVVPHRFDKNHQTQSKSEGITLSGSYVISQTQPKATNIKNMTVYLGSGKNSAGINGNYGKGENHTEFTWMDMNGDGLPDRVYLEKDKALVALNLGYSFAPAEDWDFTTIQKGESDSYGGGLGFSIAGGSISGGVSLSGSNSEVLHSLQDVNGDGLVDLLYKSGNKYWVGINNGNGFDQAVLLGEIEVISKSLSTSLGGNVAFTASVPIFSNMKLFVNPSVSKSNGVSRELYRLADIDGDGYPDFLHSKHSTDLQVKRSKIGKTNLLKEVKRPLGASFALDYERKGNTYQMPNAAWVLSRVEMQDGFKNDGVDRMLTTFAYEDGYYDRHEREFYGFKKVISRTHDTGNKDEVYISAVQQFMQDNYFRKGLLLKETVQDGKGNLYTQKENTYVLKDSQTGAELSEATVSAISSAFPALSESKQYFYEGRKEAGKSTRMSYSYDRYGNMTNYVDYGDEGAEDDIYASVVYHYLESPYLMASPKSIIVSGGGNIYRKREAEIDATTGHVTRIKQYLESGEIALHELEYNRYGNLSKLTRPANAKGERLSMDYTYDDKVSTYVVKAGNSYGYSSEATYDYLFGQVLRSKDLNGHEIAYELDKLGRVTKISGPYELKGGAGYTIAFEYHPHDSIPWALTKHYDPAFPGNPLQTAIFVDGLGRVLQTKKDGAIYQSGVEKEMMIVSGRVKFDGLGRATQAWYPVTEATGKAGRFNPLFDGIKPTTSTYDVLGRTLTVTLPDGAITRTHYGFGADNKGVSQFSTKSTDANGKSSEQFTDVRGRVTAVKNYTAEKDIWTGFVYNALGEQVEAMDDMGSKTISAYDWLGRRTSRLHPDAGLSTYSYDLAGNLTQLETANLRKEGMAVTYTYEYERLTGITYPQNPENNVRYTYGEAGAGDNRAGRVVLQEDGSGAQEFFYGPLGEVIKNVRTVVIPQHGEQTYVTQWSYDTWNRLTSMSYADGEQVDYVYNVGGLLKGMSGKKKGRTYSYVKQLGYDKFEQRVFLHYGNGTKTTYSYEADRRRLQNMVAKTAGGRAMMDNVYSYDKVNNIVGLKNNAPIPAANLMGGSSDYSYSYDDLYRLTEAKGSFKGPNDEHSYSLQMSYNSVGGILTKNQSHLRKGQVQKKTTYELAYSYGQEQPHAAIHIGEQTYSYDANGNQTGWTHDKTGQRRNIMWDEENRIRAIMDNGATYHYIYDASGERVLKGHSSGQAAFVNREHKAGSASMSNYTVYVNPYLVLKSGGYTKHYYIEGQRIVSKLGGGWDNSGKGPLKAGGDKVNYANKEQQIIEGIVKNLKFLGLDGQILTAGKSGKVPPGQLKGNAAGGGNGGGGSTSTAESFQYFYHPDHLGSTSYVTDASGEVYQHLEYFAFGETFVEEHSNTDRTPYLYNAKELDDETGLYYYGARYYDARTSIFPSVDPLAEKYAFQSPYVYAANNPIRFVDVLGMGPGDRVKKARSMQGIPYLKETTVALRTENTKEGLAKMDCSEFVSRVLHADGITQKVESRDTGALATFFSDKKVFEHSVTPKVGDIALWEGHVGIVTDVDKNGKIKLTHARGKDKLSLENPHFATPADYRSTKFLGYYRPINETPDGKLESTAISKPLPSATSPQVNRPVENDTIYDGGMLKTVIITAPALTQPPPMN